MKKLLLAFSIMVLLSYGTDLFAQSKCKIVSKIQLDGEGSWEYAALDEVNARLYVSRASLVQVMDLKTGKLAGTITGTAGMHGIAIANELGKGFVSNGIEGAVTVFDLKTLEVITKIMINGMDPAATLYDPFSQKVYTFNSGSNNATVIDAKEYRIIGSIALDGKPGSAVTDGYGKIFVNITDKDMVNVINTMTLQKIKQFPLEPGIKPGGLAMDIKNNRLFSVCSNQKMIVIDAETGRFITSLLIGSNAADVVFDPAYLRAYVANGDGTLTVVQEDANNSFRVIETVKTMPMASTIAIDTTTHHLYLPVAELPSMPAEGSPTMPIKHGAFKVLDIETLK